MILADIPSPLDPIGQATGGLVRGAATKAAEATFDVVVQAVGQALANAASKVATEVLHFLQASSSVDLDEGWWTSPSARSIVGSVAGLAAVLMVGFLLLAVIQGLAAGEPTMMLRSAFAEVPTSVFAIVVLSAVTKALLAITDGASAMVLANAPDSLLRFFGGFGTAATVTTQGLAGVVMYVVFILGAFLVWVELVVRSSLIYLLLAFSPLVLAARVWPQAKGAWHGLCRLGVALIVSKFAIALALGLGAAAVGGGGSAAGDLGNQAGLSLGGLLVGACLMLLAAFSPFVVLRILPVFEAAMVAQGISRQPARAGQTAMQGAYHAQGLRRLAGGGSGPASGAGSPSSPGSGTGPTPPGGAGPGGAGAGLAGARAGPAGGGAGAGSAGAGAGLAGGAAAAAPAAAAVMVPVGVAGRGARQARQSAEASGEAAGRSSPPPPPPPRQA